MQANKLPELNGRKSEPTGGHEPSRCALGRNAVRPWEQIMTSSTTISPAPPGAQTTAGYRWMQLILGVICMVATANIQYAWTLFVPEIQKTFGWQRAAIQTTFTIFVLVQTWLTPFEGYLIDRFGPRIMVLIGGFFTGLAWIIDSYAASLT